MNVQADREALQSFLAAKGNAAYPTGNSYIAADGTLWHQYTNMNVDAPSIWYTTRVKYATASFTQRVTNDMFVLEEVF